jgi:hypothetical protein
MALIDCYECGGKVSTSGAACPHCGAPSKQEASVAETDSLISDSAVTAENEDKNSREVHRISGALGEQVSQTKGKQHTKWVVGLILTAGLVVVFLVVAFLIPQSKHDSPETVSLINSEGSTVSCPSKNGESCMRDAERKGFVKLTDAVAGISVDLKAKPLSVIGVRGTAAEAGVRTGDILVEIDGNKVTEAFSIFRIMSKKQPGDPLTVKVLRAGRALDFTYNVMNR